MTISERTKLLTISEAALLLNVHENTLRRWCNLGFIKAFRIGPRGDRRILASEVVCLKLRLTNNNGQPKFQ